MAALAHYFNPSFLRALSLLLVVLAAPPGWAGSDAATLASGASIYQRGVLSGGGPLTAGRGPDMRFSGFEVACINCHQRSGLGAQAGTRLIPPVAGRYLFHARNREDNDEGLPFVAGMHGDREPYSEATLARAIRDGVDSEGRPLDYLMPRFALNDRDMAALIAYLKSLAPTRVPGVTESILHFATIITPEADPQKAEGMLNVLQQFFIDKNAFPFGPTPRLHSSRKLKFMANRRWQLHLWRLTGPPSGWTEQLQRYLEDEPVLAVLSGLGGMTWAPIQTFCERNALPCLFPNAQVPPANADADFYSLYFSKGVRLEADLIANRLVDSHARSDARVVQQIYRAGDSGEQAAAALAATLEGHGMKVRRQMLAQAPQADDLAVALRKAAPADAVVLWLRPADIAALADVPVPSSPVFMSGLMGSLERAPLPAKWRRNTHMAYPVDLPENRRVRVDFARGWFSIRHIPVVDEQMQTDTYLACGILAKTLSHMSDTFVRDYLIESISDMLEHLIITGYYPHLALATGQRFASKGGYLVHFAANTGNAVVAESDWIRPALGVAANRQPPAKARSLNAENRSKDHRAGVRTGRAVAAALP